MNHEAGLLSKRRGRSNGDDYAYQWRDHGTFLPPDSLSRESNYGRHLPSFEVSFEDWLSEAGVSPSRNSFRSRGGPVQWHHRPEGYLYRRKKRRRRRKRKR